MIGHLVVKLVTPAMIGGAVARECDAPPSLRPPSLRGHLRFWSRALKEGLDKKLWGDVKQGQRVRLLGVQPLTSEIRDALLIPSKKYKAPMISPGEQVLLRFAIPSDVDLEELRAVLWTWLHLGTVGRRSRRGYGSLQWAPSKDDLLADWPPLWLFHHLVSKSTLETYLKEGMQRVASVLGRPDEGPRVSTKLWELRTQDQVFVGKELPGIWQASNPKKAEGNLEGIVHGLNKDGRGTGPDQQQLGLADPRLPSPMMWRLFPVADKQAFLPVMTWSPLDYTGYPQIALGGGLYKYLHGELGFEKSLTGTELAA